MKFVWLLFLWRSTFFYIFFGQFWPILLVTDKLGTQSVVFSLSTTMNCLTMKGIGEGARQTKLTVLVDLTNGWVKFLQSWICLLFSCFVVVLLCSSIENSRKGNHETITVLQMNKTIFTRRTTCVKRDSRYNSLFVRTFFFILTSNIGWRPLWSRCTEVCLYSSDSASIPMLASVDLVGINQKKIPNELPSPVARKELRALLLQQ